MNRKKDKTSSPSCTVYARRVGSPAPGDLPDKPRHFGVDPGSEGTLLRILGLQTIMSINHAVKRDLHLNANYSI